MSEYKTIAEIHRMGLVPRSINWLRVYLERPEFADFRHSRKYDVSYYFIEKLKELSDKYTNNRKGKYTGREN